MGALGVLWVHESMTTSNLSPHFEMTLSNSRDGLSKAVGNRCRKERLNGGSHRPVGLQVGLTGLSL
jgi:hypothetical protein